MSREHCLLQVDGMTQATKSSSGARRLRRWLAGTVLGILVLGVAGGVALRLGASDAQLGSWVQAALNKQLQGTFEIGRLHWQLPATVILQDVTLRAPTDPPEVPVLQVEHAQVSINPAGLLHHQVQLTHLTLEGVRLALRQTDSLNIAAAFLPRNANADPNAAPGPTWIVDLTDLEISRSDVQMLGPNLQVHAAALALQHGTLHVDDAELSLSAALQTELQVGPQAAPQFAAPVSLRADNAVLQFATEAVDVAVQALEVSTPGLTLRAHGALQNNRAEVDASADLNPNMLTLLPAAARDLLQGTARVQTHLRSAGARYDAEIEIAGQDLQVARLPLESVALVAHVTPPQLDIEHLTLQTGAGAVDANGTLQWTDAGVGTHALHLALRDARLRRLLSAWTADTSVLPEHVTADVELAGDSLWPLGSRARLKVEAQGLPAQPLPGLPASLLLEGTVDASPRGVSSRDLQLSGDGLLLALRGSAPLEAPTQALDLDLTLTGSGLSNRVLNALHVPVQVGALTLNVQARGRMDSPTLRGALQASNVQTQGHTLQLQVPFTLRQGTLHIAQAGVQAPWAAVQLDADVQLQKRGVWLADPAVRATLAVDHVKLDGLIPQLAGVAHAKANVAGSVQHPTGEAQVQVDHLRYDRATFAEASAQAQLTREGATLTRLHIQPDSGGALDANGTAVWATHAVQAQARLHGVGLPWLAALTGAGQWAGTLEANAQIHGSWDAPQYSAEAQMHDAVLEGHRIDVLEAKARGGLENVQASVHAAGQGTTLQGQADVDLARQILRAQADGILDVSLVSALMPSVGTLSGRLALQISADGPLKSPRPRGSVHLAEALSWHPRGGVGDVLVQKVDVQLEPERITVQQLRGTWGTGSFAADGHVVLAALQPHGYSLHLRGDDLPLRTADMFVETNLNLRVTSEALLPAIQGVVEITHGRYTKEFALHDFYFVATHKNTDLPLAQTAPWLNDVQLDVTATTAAPLAIKVDAGAFAVQTSLSADLHVTGNALHPHIGGSVNAEGGALHFPKADLQLNDAMVSFVPDLHGVPVPTLSLHALSDVTAVPSASGGAGDVFTVSLTLDGPLEKLGLDLQSTPALSRLEILALLATGHANLTELTQGGGTQSSRMNAALAFAGAQLSEPLTRFAEKRLERLLNTRVDLATEVSEDQVKLTASKRINPRLRLEGGYQQAWGTDPSAVSAVTGRAQLLLTDRLMLEGGAQRDVATGGTARPTDQGPQGSLQLKWRLIGD